MRRDSLLAPECARPTCLSFNLDHLDWSRAPATCEMPQCTLIFFDPKIDWEFRPGMAIAKIFVSPKIHKKQFPICGLLGMRHAAYSWYNGAQMVRIGRFFYSGCHKWETGSVDTHKWGPNNRKHEGFRTGWFQNLTPVQSIVYSGVVEGELKKVLNKNPARTIWGFPKIGVLIHF